MAVVANVHLVVITSNDGPKPPPPAVRGQPYDRVAVYVPSAGTGLVRYQSWANDIVPVLLRAARGELRRRDPVYRVIVHNGEKAGSAAGHFDATRAIMG